MLLEKYAIEIDLNSASIDTNWIDYYNSLSLLFLNI